MSISLNRLLFMHSFVRSHGCVPIQSSCAFERNCALWKVQGYYGVSRWLINVMRSPYEHSCVHISDINLKPNKIGVLSPPLFVVLMNRVSRCR